MERPKVKRERRIHDAIQAGLTAQVALLAAIEANKMRKRRTELLDHDLREYRAAHAFFERQYRKYETLPVSEQQSMEITYE